jgi:hypothetical protein
VTVAYRTHDPTRGEPAITCYFCAEEIEVFATDAAMSVTDPKSRLWRHVATLDQHCDGQGLCEGGALGLVAADSALGDRAEVVTRHAGVCANCAPSGCA